MIAHRVLARFLIADKVMVDLALIEKLRKDFLTLVKNIPLVKDYKTAHELRVAIRIYSNRFDDMFFKHFLGDAVKYDISKATGHDVSWIDHKTRAVAWTWMSELKSMPIGFANEYYSEESRFLEFERNAPKWKARVQAKARVFWTAMREVFEMLKTNGMAPEIPVDVPKDETITLEGFQVIMHGFKSDRTDLSDTHWNEKVLSKLKQGLQDYKTKAAKILPWLIQNQLPVILDFGMTLDEGGRYNGDGTITLSTASLISERPEWATHVMAHEMGHHLFKHLGKDGSDFWYAVISGDLKELDIAELLSKWPPNVGHFTHSLMKHLETSDPVLALQLDALSHDRAYLHDRFNRDDFEKLLSEGTKTVRVPSTPITAYANKNPEEAFCEAIGLMVAYGPGRVPEQVRHWLHIAIPGKVKFARTLP
jgi:hypothetical protein